MPAQSPPPTNDVATRLGALGQQVRAHRKRLRVSATTAAQAAGVARVTLNRIERGEPSVTIGAWLNVFGALGLDFVLRPPKGETATHRAESEAGAGAVPAAISLAEFPQLRRIAWHVRGLDSLTPAEALSLYERNWRHLDLHAMAPRERSLVDALRRAAAADAKQGV